MAKDQLSSTAAAIKSLDGSAFVTLHSRLDRGGALQARKLASGAVQLYWRYSHAGKTSREPIGVYDPAARRGLPATWNQNLTRDKCVG